MVTWEIIFVFILLIAALVSFVWEKVSADVTAIIIFAVLLVAGMLPMAETLPSPRELMGVFSNAAPITIGAMFILSAALEKCGVIDQLAASLGRLTTLSYRKFLLIMILLVAFISAFINNTPVVVVFMPVILSLARQMKIPASKLLIPLSYASIFGGTCTLVGTSTNILASGIMEQSGMEPLGMFELAAVGLPVLFGATIYLLFIGNKLLPNRETLTSILSEEERKEYITEAFVQPGSSLIGKTIEGGGLTRTKGIRVLELIRNDVVLRADLKSIELKAHDRLVLSCRPSGIAEARSVEGLNLISEMGMDLETVTAHEGMIVEGIIGPKSSLTGQSIMELNFRRRFRMIVLAIHRKGINVREKLDTIPLDYGDTLLMMGTEKAIEDLRNSDDVLMLDRVPTPSKKLKGKFALSLGIVGAIVLVASLSWAPIEAAAIIGVALVFLFKCLQPKDGYQAIGWNILFLIWGMLGVGLAMETTGAVALLANGVVTTVTAAVPEAYQAMVLLLVVYLLASVLTELLSNNATVVVVTPIAIGLAMTMGIDPRPLVIAVCVASSASFATPIGYQTNTYVYGVGGYKFGDFLRIGIPLNILYLVITVTLVPLIWPFK